ncbi:MAG: hypothetical protein WBD36_03965 [Bacteroidota bacterium]
MAELKNGRTIFRKTLSSVLQIFRLIPEDGSSFPSYKAGQFIALRRENCRLTKRLTRPDGSVAYAPDLDGNGNQRRGPVTHSYSISSPPYETVQHGYLEFYVILELRESGEPGRLTESLFQLDPTADNRISYFNKITGDFTLDSRASGFKNVIFVGTGTGLAPFAGMVRQLHFEATHGGRNDVRYTLISANRGFQELGYHETFLDIEAAKKFDFVYIPSISRPTAKDYENRRLGKGRANNLLRQVLGMPLKEEQDLELMTAQGADLTQANLRLQRTLHPVLPENITRDDLLLRMEPSETVILCCGNPHSMDDIQYIATACKIPFEKEEW